MKSVRKVPRSFSKNNEGKKLQNGKIDYSVFITGESGIIDVYERVKTKRA